MRSAFIDLLIIAGLSSVGYGVWQFSPPVAFIVIGSILFCLGLSALTVSRKDIPTGENK